MSTSVAERVYMDPSDRGLLPRDPSLRIQLGVGEITLNDFFKEQATPRTNGEYTTDVEYISFNDLEAKYRNNRDLETEQSKCGRLTFRRGGEEITDLIGYNTTQPILDTLYDPVSGKPYVILGVRMEERADEINSRVIYFRADKSSSMVWDEIQDEGLPKIMGQDPSATKIGEDIILSVVEVQSVPDESDAGSHLNWWERFYKGPDVRHLVDFGRGPDGMKNITPVELPTRKITTFTRPQNFGNEELGGLGQIGEITTDSIESIIDPNALQNAPLINTRFKPGKEWGAIKLGVPLTDGRIGVIGHIASYDTDNPVYMGSAEKPKKYATISGKYNIITRKIEDVQIEAMADEFKGVVPKNELLRDVAYTTAMSEPDENGKVIMIQGVGDAESWLKEIDDPFAGLRFPLPEQNYPLAA